MHACFHIFFKALFIANMASVSLMKIPQGPLAALLLAAVAQPSSRDPVACTQALALSEPCSEGKTNKRLATLLFIQL